MLFETLFLSSRFSARDLRDGLRGFFPSKLHNYFGNALSLFVSNVRDFLLGIVSFFSQNIPYVRRAISVAVRSVFPGFSRATRGAGATDLRDGRKNMRSSSQVFSTDASRRILPADLSGDILWNKIAACFASAQKLFDKLGMLLASPVILALEGV